MYNFITISSQLAHFCVPIGFHKELSHFFQTLTNVQLVLITVIPIQLKRHARTRLDHSRARVILVILGPVTHVQVCVDY